MTLRSTVFDPSGSRVASLGDSRLNVQIPISEEAETETQVRPELVKCPELLFTGLELEKRTTLRILHKKGRRFESPWEPFFVGVYAHTLFYYANLGDWPRGVVPLVDAEVKAVDRIFRHGDVSCDGDDCGPCWKVTSSSGRVLLFRSPSHDARVEWIDQLRQATGTFRKGSMDGKAALALARRLSRSSSSASSASASSTAIVQSPRHRRRKRMSEDESEHAETLLDAMRMVEKQRKEIEELQKRLKNFEATDKALQKGDEEIKESEQKEEEDKREDDQVEEGSGDDEEIDLDTMLDGAAIEICKVSRGSAISDVLSDDDDTPSEGGNDDDGEKESAGANREEGRENIQSLSLVDESTETFSSHEDELDTQEDATDFGLNQINSNDSNDSIFSITQDDLFYDEDEEGEIERLSEFEASDSQFLEASGFLDSIHQVMKDFIVSSQPDQSRQPDQLVISDEIIAEIRQGIDAEPSKEVDDLNEAHRQRALRTDSPAADSSNSTSPRIRSLFSHARSARDFFNGDIEVPTIRTPRDLPSLVIEDTMSVVASILQSAGREDKMLLLAPFLRIFGSRNRLSHLIRWAIEIEVASVINVATLFRSDDYASRLVSTYSKAIGSKFIRVALSDPIRQIFKLKIADMELNPHKEESLQDETQVDTNAANLMRTCQNIIDSIMKNTHCIPSSYFHICSHLNSKVISRFDGSKEGVEAEDASTLTRSVIGGFLFLRFVCPAITTPHLYGLTKQLPPPETRRVLVLVTKLLFKTATGVKFGDREPQFKVLNPFIEKNSPAIQQLFANLAMSPSQDIDECFASDSRKIYSNVSSSQLVEDLETIRSISEKNLEEIGKKLEDCDSAPEVAENFKSAVLYTTDSFQKSSLTKKLSANMKFLSGFGRSRKQSDQ
ncbi:hypothetical protein JG687_00000111 [Phytophthora cactorum]|uniref:Ras-GAP domain-containing protein n=1 Tax=Phytophthora cactorum TaxID=29920 RepID=A0A8T1V238_9STRA|nr:hypothetical protein JG687_00000111 [Phytophthora cactorum]